MKLSDYLVKYLVDREIHHTFMVVGGACAHIADSLGKHKEMQVVCCQHEQAAAMAVDGYSRTSKNVGVAVATSGPGATNLITGICCLWFDSIPGLFITGQVNIKETKGTRQVRQIGFQETDIVEIIRSVTKFAVMVTEPEKIKYYLDKAFYIATKDRPGPVLIDIPLDIQHANIDPDKLEGFVPEKEQKDEQKLCTQVKEVVQMINKAHRPVFLAGMGIKIAGAQAAFREVVERTRFPVVSSWSAIDVLEHDHPLFFGQIGVYGNRGSNFLIQNSDLVLAIGSRLDTRQVSGQPKTFARGAKKIVVDIDEHELHKGLIEPDLPVRADAKDFLTVLLRELPARRSLETREWLKRCANWKTDHPAVLPDYRTQEFLVNPYVFVETLAKQLDSDAIIITDIGGITVWAMQAFQVKQGQQFFSALAHAPMGYALPAAIGAHFAEPARPIICLIGDGGMQVNIQEFQTLVHYSIPIKIFVLNNNAYGIVKQFQEIYFDGKYCGTTKESGYSAPDFVKIARAYGILSTRITEQRHLEKQIRDVLHSKQAAVCDVSIPESQKLVPKLVADRTSKGTYISKPLEDMTPFLSRDEFRKNMIINPLSEPDEETRPGEIN